MGKDHELLEAARTGNISVAEKLIFPKSKSSNFAASLGIRIGANVNCQDQNGYTPLHHASLNGHCLVVQILLNARASVNSSDNKGSCPLHLAAWNGKSEIVEMLLTSGPSLATVNKQNDDKETALHCAAQHGHTHAVKILLDNHADPKIRNIREESALDLASQYGRLEVVRTLLTFYPKLLAHSPERFTPLHLASRNGHRGVVELLLVHGADINKVSANGTALHEAALFGKHDVVGLLLKRGAETELKDPNGRTALELVSQLDTRVARDIAGRIAARIQEGDDYEPLRSIVTSTPKTLKKRPEVAAVQAPEVLSQSLGEVDLASKDSSHSSIATSFRHSQSSQMIPDSLKSSAGYRLRFGFLRRTSSTRSSRSLPRLTSSSSFRGSRSFHSFSSHSKKSTNFSTQDLSIRQHHPSIEMFPVSAAQRRTSTSEPSSPHLGSSFASLGYRGNGSGSVFHEMTPRPVDNASLPALKASSHQSSPQVGVKVIPSSKLILDGKSSSLQKSPAGMSGVAIQHSADNSISAVTGRQGDIPVFSTESSTPPPHRLAKVMSVPPEKGHKPSVATGTFTPAKPDAKKPSLKCISVNPLSGDSKDSFSGVVDACSPSDVSVSVKTPGIAKKLQMFKPALKPPPLPPKPMHMLRLKKPRPPSPIKPPPEDDDDFFDETASMVEDNEKPRAISKLRPPSPTEPPPEDYDIFDESDLLAEDGDIDINSNPPLLSSAKPTSEDSFADALGPLSEDSTEKVFNEADDQNAESSDADDFHMCVSTFEEAAPGSSLQSESSACPTFINRPSPTITENAVNLEGNKFEKDNKNVKGADAKPRGKIATHNLSRMAKHDTSQSNSSQPPQYVTNASGACSLQPAKLQPNVSDHGLSLTEETHTNVNPPTVASFERQARVSVESLSDKLESEMFLTIVSSDCSNGSTVVGERNFFLDAVPGMLHASVFDPEPVVTQNSHAIGNMPAANIESPESKVAQHFSDKFVSEIFDGPGSKCNVDMDARSLSLKTLQRDDFDSASNTEMVVDQSKSVLETLQANPSSFRQNIKEADGNVEEFCASNIPSQKNPAAQFLPHKFEHEKLRACVSLPVLNKICALDTTNILSKASQVCLSEPRINLANTSNFTSERLKVNAFIRHSTRGSANTKEKICTNSVDLREAVAADSFPDKAAPESLKIDVSNNDPNKSDSHQFDVQPDNCQLSLGDHKIFVKKLRCSTDQSVRKDYGSAAQLGEKRHETNPQTGGQDLEMFTSFPSHAIDDFLSMHISNSEDLQLSGITSSQSVNFQKYFNTYESDDYTLTHAQPMPVQSVEQTAKVVPIFKLRSQELLNKDNSTVPPFSQSGLMLQNAKLPHQAFLRIQSVSKPASDFNKDFKQPLMDLKELLPVEGNNKQKILSLSAKGNVPGPRHFRDANFKNLVPMWTESPPSPTQRFPSPPSPNTAMLQVSSVLQSAKKADFCSATLPSSTVNLSPPFSPPSPNTAMQQVSSTLKKAMPMDKPSINRSVLTSSSINAPFPSIDSRRLNKKARTGQNKNTVTLDNKFSHKVEGSTRLNCAVINVPVEIHCYETDTSEIKPPLSATPLHRQLLIDRTKGSVKTDLLMANKICHSVVNASILFYPGKASKPMIQSLLNQTHCSKAAVEKDPILSAEGDKQQNSHLWERHLDHFCTTTEENHVSINSRSNPLTCVEAGNLISLEELPHINSSDFERPVLGLFPSRPMQGDVEVLNSVCKIGDACTQTYPPKASQRRKPLCKSKSEDMVHQGHSRASSIPSIVPFKIPISSEKTWKLLDSPSIPVSRVRPFSRESIPTPTEEGRLTEPMRPNHLLSSQLKYMGLTSRDSEIMKTSHCQVDAASMKVEENVCDVSVGESSVSAGLCHLDEPTPSLLSLDTSDDWNDTMSDRTEDLNIPREVRKFKGLIRGSSLPYRSRFCGSRDPNYDSDEFDYESHFGRKAAFSRPNAYCQPEKESKRQKKFHVDVTKHSGFNCSSVYQTHIGDLSHFPTDFMEVDPVEDKCADPRSFHDKATTVTSQDFEDRSRDSSYDNNNNNSSAFSEIENQATVGSRAKVVRMESVPTIPSPMSDGLPDFGKIIDTVTAVRKKSSPQGSTSGVSSSSSSQSSTLAKQGQTSTNDEWAQIAKVMKSVGSCSNRGSVYTQEFEATFWKIMTGTDLPRRVGTWLSDLNLSQYEDVLVGNGFDNVSFLASDILEDQDLVDMNIRNVSHRRRMLDSAKNLPKTRLLADSQGDHHTSSRKAPSSVQEWLASIALESHSEVFWKMGFNSLSKVQRMKDTEIAAMISLRGHQKRARASLGRLNPTPPAQTKSMSQSSSKTSNKLKSSPPLPRSPLLDNVNFFKDYSQSLTTRSTATTNSTTLNTYGTSSSNSSALTNYSSLSDQVVPVAITEEPEPQNSPIRNKSSGSKYTRTQSEDIPRKHRSSKDKKSGFSAKLPPYNANSLSFLSPTDANQDDLLKFAIDQLTEHSAKVNEKSTNMSTSESKEIRVPNARRASYLSSSSELVLRPPNEATGDGVDVSCSWCHDPEVLIRSCCNYQAYYLGSMLVHNVKGVESTVEACAKMKKSTDSMKKRPTVTLSISYRGVKFIDSKSKHEIAEHEIQNISFASQDVDDLSTLAYITRDAKTNNHYCHVFRVTTLDVAYEIILTLGQAFEVAYQLILREKAVEGGPA